MIGKVGCPVGQIKVNGVCIPDDRPHYLKKAMRTVRALDSYLDYPTYQEPRPFDRSIQAYAKQSALEEGLYGGTREELMAVEREIVETMRKNSKAEKDMILSQGRELRSELMLPKPNLEKVESLSMDLYDSAGAYSQKYGYGDQAVHNIQGVASTLAGDIKSAKYPEGETSKYPPQPTFVRVV